MCVCTYIMYNIPIKNLFTVHAVKVYVIWKLKKNLHIQSHKSKTAINMFLHTIMFRGFLSRISTCSDLLKHTAVGFIVGSQHGHIMVCLMPSSFEVCSFLRLKKEKCLFVCCINKENASVFFLNILLQLLNLNYKTTFEIWTCPNYCYNYYISPTISEYAERLT